MADARLKCITTPNRDSVHEHITHLGGQDWKWTREQVIASIHAKTTPSTSSMRQVTARMWVWSIPETAVRATCAPMWMATGTTACSRCRSASANRLAETPRLLESALATGQGESWSGTASCLEEWRVRPWLFIPKGCIHAATKGIKRIRPADHPDLIPVPKITTLEAVAAWNYRSWNRKEADRFPTYSDAKMALFDYIEVFYNQRRRHSTLGQVSPAAFERRAAA